MAPNLERLEKVALREIWPHEAGNFTPWLTQDDNLALLEDALGLERVLEAQEHEVGPFKADILAKVVSTDPGVLIENQLERTDQTHLGQVLTYAAELNAVTIVWVAEDFLGEHRATVDGLNAITDEHFQFFSLKVELWRISASDPAPKFNLISRPNDGSYTVNAAGHQLPFNNVPETKALQPAYWSTFCEYLLAHSNIIKPQKPSPHYWADYHVGQSSVNLSAILNTRRKQISIRLTIKGPQAPSDFQQVQRGHDAIAKEIPDPFEWRELSNRKSCHIMVSRSVDPTQRPSWSAQHAWLHEQLEAFYIAPFTNGCST